MESNWPRLRQILVGAGWEWREDALYSPNETIWFQPNCDNPDHASFRDKMSEAMQAAQTDAVAGDHFQVALHEDLVSLVAALDALLDGD
ncbi:MAG: hypothetical protein AB7T06_36075 [Kofleriaceae bacterium]